jgi:NitT/TauT family transport system permease protein
MKYGREIRQRAKSALLILAILGCWEVVCLAIHVSELVLPRPSQILVALYQFFPALLPHALQTLQETLIGFAGGVLVGALLGIGVGYSRTAYDVTYPLMVGFASVPKIAVVPIFVLWFGSGFVPATLTAAVICMFPVLVNVSVGLATTEPELEDVLKALGATRLEMLINVGIPRTLPYFFASLKIAITLAFVGSVLSETIASNEGIGTAMMIASSTFNIPLVFAAISLLACLGITLYGVFALIEHRVCGWSYRRNDFAYG